MIIDTSPFNSKPPGYSIPAGQSGRGGGGVTPSNTNFERGGLADDSGASSACAFGGITADLTGGSGAKCILGGVIHCGDQNWNMDNQALNLATPGIWLISIRVVCTVNMDDASEILLPGVTTGTKPVGDWTFTAWSLGTNYPANTNPTVPSGSGTIYLPLGKLTITGGVATLEGTGCGNFTTGHCAGTLSYAR